MKKLLNLNISKKSKSTYKYFKSIDFLPIFNFFMTMETGDKRFLLKIEDYESLPEIEDITFLNKVWDEIELQHGKAEDSNRSVIQFVTAKGVHELVLEHLMLWNIYNLMVAENNGINTKECLKRAGLEDKSLKWIGKRIKVLTNKINLKREAIKETNTEDGKVDFWTILDKINDAKGYKIDPYKTTVREYLAIKRNIKTNGKR